MNELYNSLHQQQQNQPQLFNPQIKAIIDMVNNSGMSAKDLFYKMAKEKGVNPDDILKQLR